MAAILLPQDFDLGWAMRYSVERHGRRELFRSLYEARFIAADEGHACQRISEDIEVVHIADGDEQQRVARARNLYEKLNLGQRSNCASELVRFLWLVSIELHVDDSRQSAASKTVRQDDNFSRDDPLLREVLDPPRYGGPRKAQLLSELIRRPPAVLLKKSQQRVVDSVHINHRARQGT